MARYRKLPIVIEATQWFKNGDHPLDYTEDRYGITAKECEELGYEGDIVRYFRRPDIAGFDFCKECNHFFHDHGWIDTLEGEHRVCVGDFIITGVNGEHYPCKPDIFEKTYEKVED
jgi:hypothetical protein